MEQETAPVHEDDKDAPEPQNPLALAITKNLGDRVKVLSYADRRIEVRADPGNIIQAAEFLRDELGFDHAESVTGVDHPKDGKIEVVYHLGSYTRDTLAGDVIALSTLVPREENPRPGDDSTRMPSLRDVFYSVEFHERECFEMLGVYFEGHPDNRRLLLPEDWADIPPLRKDFKIKGR